MNLNGTLFISVQEKVWSRVTKEVEVALVARVQAADVPLADAREVVLHLSPVVAGDARGDGRVGHQPLDARRLQDVGGVSLQRLVVAHHVVADLAGRAQLGIGHPVDDVLAELPVHAPPPALGVAQVADKVLEAETRGGGALAVAVAFAVLADDGGRDVVLVPRLEARVLHKLVLEGRDEPLEGVPHDQELEVGVQSRSVCRGERGEEEG